MARDCREKKWFEKPVRVLQFNIEDRYGAVVSSITGRELVDLAKRINANVLVLFARDPWGRAFYRETRVNPVHPKLKRDLVREVVEEARRNNIRVVVMVGHTANKYMYRIHSDWAQVNYRGETILLEHVPYNEEGYEPEWPQMCINSPYIDYVEEEIREVLRYGVDGVFLDSFRYQPDLERACYCKWCRESFREKHGYDMPVKPNWSDSRWRELWKWRYSVVVDKLKRMYSVVKESSPDTLFMYNSHPGGWAGRTNRVVEMARDFIDVVFAECSEVDHQPPGFITEMVKLTRAMSGGKPVWASRNYFHLYRTVSPTTPLAIRQGLREAILGGGSPWLLVFSVSYRQDPSIVDAAKQVFEEHSRLEEYLDAEPLYYAGIVVSNNTRDFYGRDHPEKYVDEVRGFYYALVHSHVPVEFISEKDAADPGILRRYRVVVLANTVCCSSKLLSSIREYVANGGRVIATYMSTTMDEDCVERNEFGLSEVLGVEMKGVVDSSWSYVIPVQDHPVFSSLGNRKHILWGDMSYDFISSRTAGDIGWHVLVEPTGGSRVLAVLGLPSSRWGFEYTLGRSPPPLGVVTRNPSIVENKYGSGVSLYYTGQLGRHYWRTGLPEYGYLIRDSVLYLGGKPPVIVDAPETIASEVFMQENRVIVHLLNHTYNQRILAIGIGKTKQPLPPYSSNEAVHPPRSVVPVSGVVVRVKAGDTRYRVYSPLTGRDYEYRIVDGYAEVTIDRLGEYEVVVFEEKK